MSSTDSHLQTAELDGVLTVTFARPEKYNAVTSEMLTGLRAAIEHFGASTELRVLLIRAEGKYFTAGMDIGSIDADISPSSGAQPSGIAFRRTYRRLHALFDELEAVEKPVVVAVQGPCLGVGVEMSLSCDFRLASESATFCLPEITHLAALPGSGGISRLTRVVGPHWARWLAMAGRTVDSRLARGMGLVHDVYPDELFAESVAEFVRDLTKIAPEALALAKLAIEAAVDTDRTTSRNIDRMANTILTGTAEHRAMVKGFLDRAARKKKPQ